MITDTAGPPRITPVLSPPLAVGQCGPCTDHAHDAGQPDVDTACHTDGCPAWCSCWDAITAAITATTIRGADQ